MREDSSKKKKRTKDRNQTKHEVTRFSLFIFSPPPSHPPSFPPSDTPSLRLPLSPARSAWLILMGRPLFVNVPSCVHRCRLSIIAGLWGSFSIWRHIWHSAASINVVIILIFHSFSSPLYPFPHACRWHFDSSNRLFSIPQTFRQPGFWTGNEKFSLPNSQSSYHL